MTPCCPLQEHPNHVGYESHPGEGPDPDHPAPVGPVRLRLEALDDRIAPTVTPTLLPDGTLDIRFDADQDEATVTGTGAVIRVDDGATVRTFAAGAVRGITAQSVGGDDQAVTFTGTVGLTGNLVANQLDEVTFTAANYEAAGISVAATGAVAVDRSQLTATGGVLLTSAVAVTQPSGGLLGVAAAADSRVTVTDSAISGGSVTFEAVSTVSATAAADDKDDAARDLARVRVDSTAQVVLDGSTRVTSPGAVTITARSTTDATAAALAKSGSSGAIDAAVALAVVNTTAIARVAGDTTVTAGGAFNLLAANDATVTATADSGPGRRASSPRPPRTSSGPPPRPGPGRRPSGWPGRWPST
jgi:hypothetical protein